MSEIIKKEQKEKIVEIMRRVEKIILTPESDFENVNLEELRSMYADMRILIIGLNRYKNMLENVKDFKDIWESFKSKGNFESTFKIYLVKTHSANMSYDEDSIPS
ncbi:hypothetical protein ES695_07325 [Candidatus Atribacteria bacterium 1244-E10-H5-B2]|nr:MAG: hypothetical protein ES695_07325 [Candidatus Atribacteria bacterium 1244-E10-H5-B2]